MKLLSIMLLIRPSLRMQFDKNAQKLTKSSLKKGLFFEIMNLVNMFLSNQINSPFLTTTTKMVVRTTTF